MTPAEKLLQDFPGPVTLYPGLAGWLSLFGFAVLCGIFMLYMAAVGAVEGLERVAYFIFGVLFLAGSPVPILRMLPARNSLTLSAEGFEWRHPHNSGRVRWDETSDSSSSSVFLLDDLFDTGTVRYRPSPGSDAMGALSDRYGLKGSQLADLMNAWRSRALAGTAHAVEGLPRIDG